MIALTALRNEVNLAHQELERATGKVEILESKLDYALSEQQRKIKQGCPTG